MTLYYKSINYLKTNIIVQNKYHLVHNSQNSMLFLTFRQSNKKTK